MKKLAAALGVIAISACNPASPQPPAKAEMELQIYDVPQGTSGDLKQALARVLGNVKDSTEPSTGRVTLTPDGRLVVLAPERIQAGVRAIVDQVSKRPTAPPARVATYAYVNPVIALALGWLFAGEPFTWRVMIASVIIIAAVIMVISAPHSVAARGESVEWPGS